MKNSFYYAIMMAAVLTMMWGCSSSDDDNEPDPKPNLFNKTETELTWTKTAATSEMKIDWSSNDPVPTWTSPNSGKYESWMILMVTLQPELAVFSSENDMMAAFIGDEIRALSHPALVKGESQNVTFILKIYGNETADKVLKMKLSYYCSNLHQTFTLYGEESFVAEFVYGVEETYMPPLTHGCPKYPVQMPLSVLLPKNAQTETKPAIGDLIVVMVGNECRGIAKIDSHLFSNPYSLTVYAPKEGETATICYFNASEKVIWNTGQTLTITPSPQRIEVKM